MKQKKNVLFIVIDQLRADCLFGALADHVDLPNLRALMAQSACFKRHYSVTNPCGPSRVSILTSRYAMNHRSVRNGTPLAYDTPNIATELRGAGYLPMLFGYTDTAQDPRAFAAGDPALASYEQPMRGFEEIVEMRMGDSYPWRADLLAKGYQFDNYDDVYKPVTPAGATPRADDPALYKAEDSDTAFLTNACLRELRAREGAPWFAHLTYIRPHPPLNAPAPYNRMYDGAALPLPARLTREAEEAFHPYIAPLLDSSTPTGFVSGLGFVPPTDENVQMLRAIYLGLATEVDHHIGRITEYLKTSGQWDDTLLVVTADHGEMLGDRHAWGKMAPYDAAFQTPLIVHMPGGEAQEITAQTESIDVTPTILDWLGIARPSSMDGRSLLPFLHGETPEWRDYSYSELDFADPFLTTPWQTVLGTHQSNSNLAILREDRLTLVQFSCDLPPLLFDRAGKGELENIAERTDMQGELYRMTLKLLRHRMCHADHTLSTTMITGDGPVVRPRVG